MLDMKFVRENPELVMDAMRKRNANVNMTNFWNWKRNAVN